MRIRWTNSARQHFAAHITYVAADNPNAVERIKNAIVSSIEQLADQPYRGKPGRRAGTREQVIAEFPTYVVAYRATETEIRIIRVWHGPQTRDKN